MSAGPPIDTGTLVDGLLGHAESLLVTEPIAAIELLRAALVIAAAPDRPTLRMRLADAQMAAGQGSKGEGTLTAVLIDEGAPDELRRQAAFALVSRQIAQFRLTASADTIRTALSIPSFVEPAERTFLTLLAEGASLRFDGARLRELDRLARHSRPSDSWLPAFALPYLASQVSAAFGAIDEAIAQLRQAITVAETTQAVALRVQLVLALAAYDPAAADAILPDVRRLDRLDTAPLVTLCEMFTAVLRADWTTVLTQHASLTGTTLADPLVAFQALVVSWVARARTDVMVAQEVERLIRSTSEIDADDWFSRINLDVARANARLARSDARGAALLLVATIEAVEQSDAVGVVIKFAGHVGTLLDAGDRAAALRLAALVDVAAQRHPNPCLHMYQLWQQALLTDDPDLHLAALEMATRSAVHLEDAEMHERAGLSLIGAGRRDDGIEVLRGAAVRYADAGAWGALNRVRAALRSCGVRLRAHRADGCVLTRTESAVAELAGSGLTNAVIAKRLGMSVGTAGTHLSRVYRKLGIASRIELVARAERGALTRPDRP